MPTNSRVEWPNTNQLVRKVYSLRPHTHIHSKHKKVHNSKYTIQNTTYLYQQSKKYKYNRYAIQYTSSYGRSLVSTPYTDRDNQSATTLLEQFWYRKSTSNSCSARDHLISLALLGAHSLMYCKGLWSQQTVTRVPKIRSLYLLRAQITA